MSFKDNNYSVEQLRGNTDFPRSVYATVRASKRRSDPLGSSAVPFYTGLTGKKLTVEFSTGPTSNPDSSFIHVTFPSDSYADALAAINTAIPVNPVDNTLEAFDADGYMAIRHKTVGGINFLKIKAEEDDPELEAAGILGFEVDPYPGSAGYVGELESTPGVRRQSNPQGTALIGRDEDLTSAALNRALMSVLRFMQTAAIDLDRDVTIVEDIDVVLHNNQLVAAADGVPLIDRPNVLNVLVFSQPYRADRIWTGPFKPPGISSPADVGALEIQKIVKLYFADTGDELFLSSADGGGRYRVRSLHHCPISEAETFDFRTTQTLATETFDPPQKNSIFGYDTSISDKHPNVEITEIRSGNIVRCAGATFKTSMVLPGDTVYVNGSTNEVPFNHDGEFAVLRVIDEETLALRPKSTTEPPVYSQYTTVNFQPSNYPSELNPVGGGSLKVPIGWAFPMAHLHTDIGGVTHQSWIVGTLEHVGGTEWGLTTAYLAGRDIKAKVRVCVPLREVTAKQLANDFNVSVDTVREAMDAVDLTPYDNHIATGGHAANKITWPGAQPQWVRTSENIPGTELETLIRNIVLMLSDNATSPDAEFGSSRIGSAAIAGTSPDNTPNSLAAGTIKSQLQLLLTDINHHINDAVAHSGGAGGPAYSGSPNWADATSIAGGISLDAAIDRIVTDLGGSGGANGAAKVAIAARSDWLGGGTNPATSVFGAVDKIITDLARTTAGNDGAERVGAQSATDLPAGSVRSQLDYLAVNWGKLSRANTWTAANTFNGATGDTSPALITDAAPVSRKLVWRFGSGTIKSNLYLTTAGGWEWVWGASWNGSQWVPYAGTANQTRLIFDDDGLILQEHTGTAAFTSWSAGSWNIKDTGATSMVKAFGLWTYHRTGPSSVTVTAKATGNMSANTASCLGSSFQPTIAGSGYASYMVVPYLSAYVSQGSRVSNTRPSISGYIVAQDVGTMYISTPFFDFSSTTGQFDVGCVILAP